MLAPRFTIRALLLVLTAGALVFLIAGMAVRGEMWAWGVTIGALCLVVTMLVHGAVFGVVWLFARLIPARAQAVSQPASDPNPAAGG